MFCSSPSPVLSTSGKQTFKRKKMEQIQIEEPTPASGQVQPTIDYLRRSIRKKKEIVKKYIVKMTTINPSSTTPKSSYWLWAHRFPMLFCLCFGLYSFIFPYLFMTSKSLTRQYQSISGNGETNVFWWFATVERLIYGMIVIVGSYFGGKSEKKTKWIGFGFLMIAFGCFFLSMTAFIAPLPVVELEEDYLWKGIYHPATKQDITTPHNLMNSYWGQRFPEDVRTHLNETGNRLAAVESKLLMDDPIWSTMNETAAGGKSKRSMDDNEIDRMFADSIANMERELTFGMEQEGVEDESSDSFNLNPSRRLVKRQMPDFEFPDSTRDRLKEGFEAAVIGMMWFGDSYGEFSQRVYNLTNDPEIFDRLMKAARLPFAYCRNTSNLVRERLRTKTCQQATSGWTMAAMIMGALSVLMMGVGGAVVGTVGLPYVEDLIGWKNLPKYLICLAAIHYIFTAIGMGVGKVCDMLLYSTMNAPTAINPIDPRWVGAWWLGLLVIFVLMKIVALIMIRFGTPTNPKYQVEMIDGEATVTTTVVTDSTTITTDTTPTTNGTHEGSADTTTTTTTVTKETTTNGEVNLELGGGADQADKTSYTVNPKPGKRRMKVIGLLEASFEIFRPPVFVSLMFAMIFHVMSFYGYFMFLPVYLNNNFVLDPFFNGTYLTAMGGMYLCLGLTIGAVFVYRFKFDARKLAMLLAACAFIIFTVTLLQKWVGCSRGTVARLQEMSLKNPTNRPSWPSCPGCICESADFYPVCANDTHRTPFYSPCHAGCANFTYKVAKMDVEFTFDYCACTETKRTLVARKFCHGECNMINGFFYVLFAFVAITAGVLIVPSILIAMRTCAQEHRSLSLGVFGFCVYILGILPSSVLYRFVTDSSCFIWKSTCGLDRGHCEMYDTVTLQDRYHGIAALLNLLSFGFFCLVWYHSNDMNLRLESARTAIVELMIEPKKEDLMVEINLKDEKIVTNGETVVPNGDSATPTAIHDQQNTFIGKL